MPSAAGAPIRLRIALRDPSTSATSTSAYGSISRKNVFACYSKNGLARPMIVGGSCIARVSWTTAPNR